MPASEVSYRMRQSGGLLTGKEQSIPWLGVGGHGSPPVVLGKRFVSRDYSGVSARNFAYPQTYMTRCFARRYTGWQC